MEEIHIYLDTNLVRTEKWCWFLAESFKKVIAENDHHADLRVVWHLPDVALYETLHHRWQVAEQYATAVEGLHHVMGELPAAIDRNELRKKIENMGREECAKSGVELIRCTEHQIDLNTLARDAAFRYAPFSPDGEKGFRDSLICALSYLHAGTLQPKAHIVFASEDNLVRAAYERFERHDRMTVVKTLADVEELIHRLTSKISEVNLERARTLAEKTFYIPKDETCLYRTAKVMKQVFIQSKRELNLRLGHSLSGGGSQKVGPPKFLGNDGRTYTWKSAITRTFQVNEPAPSKESLQAQLRQLVDPQAERVVHPMESRRYRHDFEVTWSFKLTDDQRADAPTVQEIALVRDSYEEAQRERSDILQSLLEKLSSHRRPAIEDREIEEPAAYNPIVRLIRGYGDPGTLASLTEAHTRDIEEDGEQT